MFRFRREYFNKFKQLAEKISAPSGTSPSGTPPSASFPRSRTGSFSDSSATNSLARARADSFSETSASRPHSRSLDAEVSAKAAIFNQAKKRPGFSAFAAGTGGMLLFGYPAANWANPSIDVSLSLKELTEKYRTTLNPFLLDESPEILLSDDEQQALILAWCHALAEAVSEGDVENAKQLLEQKSTNDTLKNLRLSGAFEAWLVHQAAINGRASLLLLLSDLDKKQVENDKLASHLLSLPEATRQKLEERAEEFYPGELKEESLKLAFKVFEMNASDFANRKAEEPLENLGLDPTLDSVALLARVKASDSIYKQYLEHFKSIVLFDNTNPNELLPAVRAEISAMSSFLKTGEDAKKIEKIFEITPGDGGAGHFTLAFLRGERTKEGKTKLTVFSVDSIGDGATVNAPSNFAAVLKEFPDEFDKVELLSSTTPLQFSSKGCSIHAFMLTQMAFEFGLQANQSVIDYALEQKDERLVYCYCYDEFDKPYIIPAYLTKLPHGLRLTSETLTGSASLTEDSCLVPHPEPEKVGFEPFFRHTEGGAVVALAAHTAAKGREGKMEFSLPNGTSVRVSNYFDPGTGLVHTIQDPKSGAIKLRSHAVSTLSEMIRHQIVETIAQHPELLGADFAPKSTPTSKKKWF